MNILTTNLYKKIPAKTEKCFVAVMIVSVIWKTYKKYFKVRVSETNDFILLLYIYRFL